MKHLLPVLCLVLILAGCISGTTVRQNPTQPSASPTASTQPSAQQSPSPTASATPGVEVQPTNPAQNSSATFFVTGPANTNFNVTVTLPGGSQTLTGTTDATGNAQVLLNVGQTAVGTTVQVTVVFVSGQTGTTTFTVSAASPSPSATP